MTLITNNQQETHNLGMRLAKNLKGGSVVALYGNLGAGKTVLVKGLAKGLGIKETVRSPSFNLMKTYPIIETFPPKADPPLAEKHENMKTVRKLVHLDCYRLTDPREAVDIGLLDYLGKPDTIVVIEWAERVEKLLKKIRTMKVRIEMINENQRQITLPYAWARNL